MTAAACLVDLVSRYSQRADKVRYLLDVDGYRGIEQIQRVDAEEALKSLSEREVDILTNRYVNGMEFTLIGRLQKTPVSRERVIQLHNRALFKLAHLINQEPAVEGVKLPPVTPKPDVPTPVIELERVKQKRARKSRLQKRLEVYGYDYEVYQSGWPAAELYAWRRTNAEGRVIIKLAHEWGWPMINRWLQYRGTPVPPELQALSESCGGPSAVSTEGQTLFVASTGEIFFTLDRAS